MVDRMRLPETSIDIEASAALFADKDGFTQYHQGRAMWKTKDDLDRYRILLAGDAIDLLIETGTRWGGFAAWVADTFGIDVITIDTSPAIHGSLPSRVARCVRSSAAVAPWWCSTPITIGNTSRRRSRDTHLSSGKDARWWWRTPSLTMRRRLAEGAATASPRWVGRLSQSWIY
jgi:hypothetical protein